MVRSNKKARPKITMFSLDSLKEFVCLFVCPRKQEAEEKNVKSLKKKRKKTTVCRLFTHEDCCATDYHDHVSLPPRDRERERETERQRDFVVVVKKKKKTTTGFERERSDARETKRTVSVWGNSI